MFAILNRLRPVFIMGLLLLSMLIITVDADFQAQSADLHLTEGLPTGDWIVQVQPGTDVSALAARQGFQNLGQIGTLTGYYRFRPLNPTLNSAVLQQAAEVIRVEPELLIEVTARDVPPITDPLYPQQWHLRNTGQEAGGVAGNDASVYPAWEQGYTGSGVVLSMVDDGLWWNNPDLVS
ncbi:MAG: hypothetical protein H7X77_08285, partial [Anaerolineae bacterium]|nr:hypothetical protein [Anaerolineae bacterium]